MTNNEHNEMIFQAEKARAKLLTRLNLDTSRLGNEYNQVMADLLNSLTFSETSSKNRCQAEALI